MKNLTSAIIICTRNRPDDIINLLRSIQVQKKIPEELIIVDSSDIPLDQQQQFIATFSSNLFPRTSLLYKHVTKAGIPYQRNVGAQVSSSDLLHFVDDDTILEDNYIAQMNAAFEHQDFGGGMGYVTNIYPKKNNIDRLLRMIFLLQRDYASGNFTLSGMPTHAYGTNQFKTVQVLGGCCMSYRRELFLHYLADEQLAHYAYMEDVDISWRISRKYKLFYNPAARLQHLKSPTNRATIAARRALFIKNYRYLFFKNVYPNNRIKLVAHYWSIAGLFVCAFVARDLQSFRGYWKGLFY